MEHQQNTFCFLQALSRGGLEGLDAEIRQVLAEIRFAHLLTGSRTPDDLRRQPFIAGPRLKRWVVPGTSVDQRC